MRQRPIAILFITIGLVLLVAAPNTGAPPASGMQQELPTAEATPDDSPNLASLVAPYPDGVTLTARAIVSIADTPTNPATLRLERYALAPGETLTGAISGPRLIVVESGEIRLTSNDLPDGTYGEGAVAMIPPGVAADLSPTGSGTTFLQFRVDPRRDSEEAPGLEAPEAPAILVAGSARVPRGEATLTIVEVEVAPGVDVGQRVFSGPVGLAVESGVLTVVGLDGQATRVEAGSGLIAPAYTAHQIRNDGPDPVRGIAVGILPASPGLAGAPLATPTPAQDPAATATVAALVQSQADLRATVTARERVESGLRATIAAQRTTATGAISDAQATSAAIAVDALDLAAALATSSAQSFESDATAASLRTTIAAGEDDLRAATARESSLLATTEAMAAARTAQETNVAALGTRADQAEATAAAAEITVSGADATIAAQAVAVQTIVATATAHALQNEAARGTLTAGLAAAEGTLVAQETLVAELARAQGTVTAQASAIAALEAATPPSIEANFVPVTLKGNLFNVVSDPTLRAAIVAEVREQLQPEIDRGCTAGLVLTFGHSPDVGQGVDLAAAINALLATEMPDVFGNAVTEDFVSFEQPFGSAEVRVYFTSDCGTVTPTSVPPSPTSPPIVPTQ